MLRIVELKHETNKHYVIETMPHVIFMSPHCDPQASLGETDSGGQCIYEHQLALSLAELPDFKVTTFCRQTFKRPDVTEVNNSYSIRRVICGGKARILKEDIEQVIPEFSQIIHKYIKEEVKDESVALHGHYWDGGCTALHIKMLSKSKLPLVWTPHSLGDMKRERFRGGANEMAYNFIPRIFWESYSMLASDAVIVSTEHEKLDTLQDYAVDGIKTHVMPPGIRFDELKTMTQSEAREKLGLPLNGKLLLCLGRMVRTKGYEFAIEALAELKKRFTQPITLMICGGSTQDSSSEEQQYHAELQELAKKYNLSSDVIFHDAVPHDQVYQMFSAADVFLMTSRKEPFGLVTLEAMAMNVPIVASNTGGSVNLIRHNRTGILVKFDDASAVASYTLSLLKDDEYRKTMVEAAGKFVRREFDWRTRSERFAQVYRQISRHSDTEPFQELVKQKYFLERYFRTI